MVNLPRRKFMALLASLPALPFMGKMPVAAPGFDVVAESNRIWHALPQPYGGTRGGGKSWILPPRHWNCRCVIHG